MYEIGMSRYAYMDRLIMGEGLPMVVVVWCHGQCFHLSPLPHRGYMCVYVLFMVCNTNGDLSLCSTLVPRVLLVSPIGNVVFVWLHCICEESFHNSSSIPCGCSFIHMVSVWCPLTLMRAK